MIQVKVCESPTAHQHAVPALAIRLRSRVLKRVLWAVDRGVAMGGTRPPVQPDPFERALVGTAGRGPVVGLVARRGARTACGGDRAAGSTTASQPEKCDVLRGDNRTVARGR